MNSDTAEFRWSFREIRSRIRRTVFTKGLKPYFVLILIIFFFSFIGILQYNASGLINTLDMQFGRGIVQKDDILNILDYVKNTGLIQSMPEFVREEIVIPIIWSVLSTYSWLINLFAMNRAYMARNLGEVFVFIMLFMVLYKGITSFFKKTLAVGLNRAIMENRFQRDVKIRRILAPFGNHKFLHVIGVMCIYIIVMALWWVTIIGGIIKHYQYLCVPYLLAENPDLSWKQARNLSKKMTHGYKWKMFLLEMSYLYLLIPGFLIPLSDLFLVMPIDYTMDAEMYFTLRQRPDINRSKFIETAFDNDAYVDRVKAGEKPEDIHPEYLMPDLHIRNSSFDEADSYHIMDYIAMFFIFCFIGWLWEVGLHLVKDMVFVNRGVMYGPWLPIYGAGGVCIIALLNKLKHHKLKLFICTMLLRGVIEYFTSFVIEFFNNMSYWDYHNMQLNLNGRVCMAGLLAFDIGGFLGIFIVGPLIKNLMRRLGPKKAKIVCSVLVALFVIDMICCSVFGPNAGEGIGVPITSHLLYLMLC
jgi:uncharacterized membrane protein